MRRFISPALIGLGAFLVVAGVLARVYAYPQLAVVPTNYESVTELEATGATIFNSDPSVLAPETTDLSISSKTTAAQNAKAPDGVVVWANTVSVRKEDGTVFQRSVELAPFDANTGVAVDCCGSFAEDTEGEQTPVARKGQVYKFPFDTQKKDYLQWDSSLGEATPAKFVAEEKVKGLTVYKFVQEIEPTVIAQQDVPGSVFDVEDASVTADMVYGMNRTFYIEPVTGAAVQRVEVRNQVLAYDGTEIPAFTGTVQYTQKTVDDTIDDVKTRSVLLGGMRLVFPLVLGLVGLLAIGLGLFLRRREQGPAAVAPKDEKLVRA